MRDVNIYEAADRAVQIMNRDMLRDFGKLKTARMDELHLIQEVSAVYRKQAEKARKRYYEIGIEAYILGLYLCGIGGRKAHEMAEKAITLKWVQAQMEETNLVTRYRFNAEAERKAQRLAETLEAAAEVQRGRAKDPAVTGTDAEIDRAVRAWSKQVANFALCIADAAVIEAYEDAEIAEGEWVAEKDSRVCSECRRRDGKVYPLLEMPVKPHPGCRCRVRPVKKMTGTQQPRISTGKPD